MDNAYFDGVMFVCPDCGYEWSNERISSARIVDFENEAYDRLIKFKKPFFKLKHGKLYDCTIESDHGIEDMSIIPLAFEETKNRQFVMIDARRLFNNNRSLVFEIIKMDFETIMNDGIQSEFPHDYESLTIVCTTQEDGTFLDYLKCVYSDFIETSEI